MSCVLIQSGKFLEPWSTCTVPTHRPSTSCVLTQSEVPETLLPCVTPSPRPIEPQSHSLYAGLHSWLLKTLGHPCGSHTPQAQMGKSNRTSLFHLHAFLLISEWKSSLLLQSTHHVHHFYRNEMNPRAQNLKEQSWSQAQIFIKGFEKLKDLCTKHILPQRRTARVMPKKAHRWQKEVKTIQDWKPEFSKEIEILNSTQAKMKMALKT